VDGKVTKEKITSSFTLTESQTEMLNALWILLKFDAQRLVKSWHRRVLKANY
jgi:hypothetical protein